MNNIIDLLKTINKDSNINDIIKKFKDLIKSISVSKQEINYKILQEFNKDFYKEFIK